MQWNKKQKLKYHYEEFKIKNAREQTKVGPRNMFICTIIA